MDRNAMIERLEYLALAGPYAQAPEWLAPNAWAPAIAEVAAAALDAIPQWRPIAEAPIPPPEGLPIYWIYPCLLQTETGDVVAGFARYVDTNARGVSPRVLRWYEGVSQRYAMVPKPKYFMPLPQPRKD